MRDTSVLSIIRPIRPLSPTDSIGKAAESLRVSGLGELPVIDAGCLAGLVSEEGILSALTRGDAGAISQNPVTAAMSRKVICANRYMSIGQAADILDQHQLRTMPVVDEHGTYLGVISRADVASALCRTIRPPTVAGMATPLGVYLTTGNVRAGAGDLALVMAGVALMLLNYLSFGIVSGIEWVIGKSSPYLAAVLKAGPAHGPWGNVLDVALAAASVPIFLVLLRLAPLSGYHAAEHQVVHAIEEGEPLTLERVRNMSRVHPRCGTNIVVAATLFLIVSEAFSNEIATVLAILILIFAWRIVGSYFQYYVTTKTPSDRQLENGIRAGSELLQRYQELPTRYATGWRRIWNTGMPQVMLGVASTEAVWRILLQVPKLF